MQNGVKNDFRKRSVLPFIDKALNVLFGTMSESDAEAFEAHIAGLEKNQQKIKQVVEENLSIVNVTRFELS